MAFFPETDYLIFKKRRKRLLGLLKEQDQNLKNGLIILFANFEENRNVFRQDSSFYYLTGIREPAAVFVIYFDGTQFLYLPNYGGKREQWCKSELGLYKNQIDLKNDIGINEIKFLGQPCKDYSFEPTLVEENYSNFISDINSFFESAATNKNSLTCFSPLDWKGNNQNLSQKYLFDCLLSKLNGISDLTKDLSNTINFMRRSKDEYEIDLIKKSVNITIDAHKEAAKNIKENILEYDVQAFIEFIFTRSGCERPAFPSIVACGKNTTILHYIQRNEKLKNGDLVVVDIGAEYAYYASDLSRTYPVSGSFSKEQRKIYNLVLNAQKYAESIVEPGMFLNGKDPERSLTHLVRNFFAKKGYGDYFYHGIGHFIGLDVHDVSSADRALSFGDVFTIEPGLYIPEKAIGVRIEDNYLMTPSGLVCLSSGLPKRAEDVENMMQE